MAHRLLILGGGAGGLELASQFAGHGDIEVTLVDREATHVWKPRLHELAAGTVSTSLSEISFYRLGHLRQFRFEQGSVEALDPERRTVRLAALRDRAAGIEVPPREIGYDGCVVALGGVTADFGVEGVTENAVRLDGKEDADAFRERFVLAMIGARESGRPADVVIVGSGATGTELAAHLRNSERAFFDQNARERETKLLDITILEAGDELMPGASDELRRGLAARLRELDVKVVTNVRVSAVDRDEVRAGGERWPATLTVWAGGLTGSPVLGRLGPFQIDKRGRIVVDETLAAEGVPHVWAMGDATSLTPRGSDKPLPPTAQVASQQADYLAEVLPLTLKGEPVEPFRYRDRGKLVSLARAGAVGSLPVGRKNKLEIDGVAAVAAYNALQRQHQWRVLGPWRGTVAIAADMVSPAKGPALKLHGD
ncbi:NAD(P)/FAD-dependent oxidoreductase [Aureimonas jatrophae]|uniref:NADH dehydrogenase n=1 Tax=Aureimonas jatrophae TaxID=1166073 RepID=A0A1H0D7F5_9HYPH|nr:FAD-dependent oxidoreductase [Aureimonas jatrophae]MBB3951734.1 NADH dehydrogenase [Aureimonas jatrophae]SDN65871.1 NADH dehydrogenase [Aureimonas jatrophae]